MKLIHTKTKLVFLPLLWLALIFIAAYTFLYWLFWIKLDIVPLREDIVQYWLPCGIAALCIYFFIRPRVHLLKLDKNDGKMRTVYYMIGVAVCVAPAIFLMHFLDTATGKLTQLESITEISKKPLTRYYNPNSYVLPKDYIGIESGMEYSGKNNQNLVFNLYIALPVIGHLFDTLKSPPAFLFIKYQDHISSKIKGEERSAEWKRFWEESFKKFETELIHFEYLERMPNTEDRENIIIAAKNSDLYKPGSPLIILKPIDEPFEERNGNKIKYALLSFAIGLFIWFIIIIIPGIHENKVKKFAFTNRTYIQKQLFDVYKIFRPIKGFVATPILVILNVLVFIVMVFKGFGFFTFYTRDLVPLGALYQPLVEEGEWWRLITSMFLHGGIIHLFMNMLSLYLGGIFLERSMGTKRFVIAYIISGIAAGLISLWWHDIPVVAVGASGAIFGLYGILLAFIFTKVFDKEMNKTILILLACTAGYSLLMGFLSEGIDNGAHVGGLIAGLVIGFIQARFMVKAEKPEGL